MLQSLLTRPDEDGNGHDRRTGSPAQRLQLLCASADSDALPALCTALSAVQTLRVEDGGGGSTQIEPVLEKVQSVLEKLTGAPA
eukprot:COSAG01_NODE_29201_length_642_cov_156.211786_1_plen_84_part_00